MGELDGDELLLVQLKVIFEVVSVVVGMETVMVMEAAVMIVVW